MVKMKEERPGPEGRDGATETRILAAAHAVFLRRGTAGARMQEIADEAGVNKALLHYYFRNKERMAAAVFEEMVGQMLPRVWRILGSDASLPDKVRQVVEVELAFLSERPYLPGYVVAELNFNPERIQRLFADRGPPPLDRVQAQLDAHAADGSIRPVRAEQFLVNMMSLVLFPFVARPLLDVIAGTGGEGFARFIEERKAFLADFILAGMRP